MPFTTASWDNPVGNLSADDYCAVCLIDLNEPGEAKIKGNCKLPVQSRPDGPYNINALRAAAAALGGARTPMSLPAEARRKAAAKLLRLMHEAKMTPGAGLARMAQK